MNYTHPSDGCRLAAQRRAWDPVWCGALGEAHGRGARPGVEPESAGPTSQFILDWHNEWYNGAQRVEVYRGQAAMDCPLCRQAVLWFESRDIAAPAASVQPPVHPRSAILAAQWVPVREPSCINLAGYIAGHPAGQQYRGYWPPSEVQQADQQVPKP